MSALLEHRGHEVRVVHDGPSALRVLDEQPVDAAVCNIGLPGMDGYDLARSIRSRPETRGLKLVALSGYGSPEDRSQSFRAGFDAHLVKPIDMSQLEDVL